MSDPFTDRLAKPEDWDSLDKFDEDEVLAAMEKRVADEMEQTRRDIEREKSEKAAAKAAKAATSAAADEAGPTKAS